jgi:hypothetical protein
MLKRNTNFEFVESLIIYFGRAKIDILNRFP